MEELNLIQKITVYALPVLFAITVHEAAHAYAAKRFGDPTAYIMGRMTLNPLKHIDPLGTVLLPIIGMLVGGFIFGWAKPVPINFGNLRNPRVGMRWVSAAGPLANLLMALVWTGLFKFAVSVPNYFSEPLALMSQAGIMINCSLMVLNLLPILPLDGGRIVESLLPPRLAWRYARTEAYGTWILLGMMMLGMLSWVLYPLVRLLYTTLLSLFFVY
jgi:Zn-dependent protease